MASSVRLRRCEKSTKALLRAAFDSDKVPAREKVDGHPTRFLLELLLQSPDKLLDVVSIALDLPRCACRPASR